MARKRQAESPAEEQPPPADAAATTNSTSHGNGTEQDAVRRPATSWALNSDRTTRIEVSVWVNNYEAQNGEQYEQVTFTIQRSYRTDEGWQRGGAFRTHDLPVLLFLFNKGHAWALERRTADASIPF